MGGSAKVAGVELAGASEKVARGIRGRVVGLVPQDPTVSLNPTQRIGHQVGEAVRLRGVFRSRSSTPPSSRCSSRRASTIRSRGPGSIRTSSPGGLRQRVLIAIALAGKPDVIVADEPTSALDVTVQRRILDHLDRLVRERGIALVIITHDLGVAADRADRVVVMREGRVVEQGRRSRSWRRRRTEYTRSLVAAAPGLTQPGAAARPRQVDARGDRALGGRHQGLPAAGRREHPRRCAPWTT